jgi:amino-acid N-acetyltransferase
MSEALPTGDGLLIRSALLSDVTPLLALINTYASQGIMLPRTELELAENIRDFTIAATGGALVGCGALHFYGTRTAEVRSLAVHPHWKQQGVGKRLMGAIEAEAAAHGIQSLFAFTYVPTFFLKLDFVEVDRRLLPSKVWKDCLRCPKLQCCDEIAMQKLLIPADAVTAPTAESALEDASNGLIILPTFAGGSRSL